MALIPGLFDKPKKPWVRRGVLERLFPGKRISDLTPEELRQYKKELRPLYKTQRRSAASVERRRLASTANSRKLRAWLKAQPKERQQKFHRDQYDQYQRRYRLKKEYGLTLEQYDAMKAAQGGKCAICDRTHSQLQPTKIQGDRLHVDHDHKTGKVRGLLCHHCNMVLGHLGDNIERMQTAIRYLQFHREQHGAVVSTEADVTARVCGGVGAVAS